MDHSEAIRGKSAEAYLLGDLSGPERRAFEEHFFTCQDCASDLQAGSAFIDAYKDRPRNEPFAPAGLLHQRPARSYRAIYALAASILFAAVLLYQNVVTIPKLRQSAAPQVLESFSLESVGSRGIGPTIITPPRGRPFVILFDIPPSVGNSAGQSEYRCEVRTAAGATAASFLVSAAAAQRTVPMFIPASQLKPGKYSLLIMGDHPKADEAGDAVAQYPFEVQ